MLVTGCAQPVADNTFTVRQIDSTSRASDGTVRIKLQTSGTMAEADESMLVQYVAIVAVHEATKRQRQVAQQRAKAAYHKMNANLSKSQHPARKKARYLAVVTEKEPRKSGRKVAKSVMIWDTQSEEIVGNNVYDVESTPAIGSVARFETFSAQYIGTGM